MGEKQEPTQRTEQGHEIPVPKRSAWNRLLGKAAKPLHHRSDDQEDSESNPPKRDNGLSG